MRAVAREHAGGWVYGLDFDFVDFRDFFE